MKPLSPFVLFFPLLLVSHFGHAQVVIEKLPFAKALQKAEEQGKILMVIMDAKLNRDANKITTERLNRQTTFIINQQAVVIRPPVFGTDWNNLASKYYEEPNDSNNTVVGLFFNGNGDLVHSCQFSSTDPNTYFNQAFLAKRIAGMPSEKDLYKSLQSSGFTNLSILNELVMLRRELSQPNDDLLERFISFTPIDSFKSFPYFLSLARFCPILQAKADSILRSSNFNANWSRIDATEQAYIYQNINSKTIEKAVWDKNDALAHYLIDSTDNNALVGAEEKDKPLLRKGLISHHYWRVHDTAAFIATAMDYADNYLMKLNLDSLNAVQKAAMQKMKKSLQPGDILPVGWRAKYGSQLHFNAWQFYKVTSEPYLLEKALRWIERAIELNSTPEAYGAYALLLYKTGNRTLAIKQEKRLIRELQNQHRYDEVAKCERILNKMKHNEEKADE